MSTRLTRLQKTGALVPMALLVTAWGVTVGNSGWAGAVGGIGPFIPDVPASALEQPATVERITGGVDPQAGIAGTMTTLSTNGIPSAALYAYHHAQALLAGADSQCHLPWNLLAAIGRAESNHGRTDGNALSVEGVAEPGIYGAASKRVKDTDQGKFDKDTSSDRPVGPMQIMPSIWAKYGVDADANGVRNPQDIDDEAATAGVFLCSGTGDLSTPDGARAAVARYNNSQSYVDLVMKVSDAYANGEYSQTPDGFTAATILTSQSNDQTLTADERKKAKKKEEDHDHHHSSDNGGSTSSSGGGGTSSNGGGSSSGGGNDNGGSNGGSNDGSDGGNNGGSSGGGSKAVENVTKTVKKTTDKVNETVKKTTDKVNETTKKLTDKLKKLGKKKDDDKSDDSKKDDSKSDDKSDG